MWLSLVWWVARKHLQQTAGQLGLHPLPCRSAARCHVGWRLRCGYRAAPAAADTLLEEGGSWVLAAAMRHPGSGRHRAAASAAAAGPPLAAPPAAALAAGRHSCQQQTEGAGNRPAELTAAGCWPSLLLPVLQNCWVLAPPSVCPPVTLIAAPLADAEPQDGCALPAQAGRSSVCCWRAAVRTAGAGRQRRSAAACRHHSNRVTRPSRPAAARGRCRGEQGSSQGALRRGRDRASRPAPAALACIPIAAWSISQAQGWADQSTLQQQSASAACISGLSPCASR